MSAIVLYPAKGGESSVYVSSHLLYRSILQTLDECTKNNGRRLPFHTQEVSEQAVCYQVASGE